MSFWDDAVADWVGDGLYGCASRSRVDQFIAAAGFATTRFVQTRKPTEHNQYIFRRYDSRSAAATLEPR